MKSMARRNLNSCFTKIKSPPSPPGDHLSRPFSRPTSLYVKTYNSIYETAASETDSDEYSTPPPPSIATAFASRRFFFSSPGRSNSIIDSASASTSSLSSNHIINNNNTSSSSEAVLSAGSVAVPAFSADPFADFRRSMQEMVEAREISDVRENWDYLHELLMCYLSLNPKSTHKYIVGAFADLLVGLMTAPIEKGKFKIGEFQW